MNDKFDKSGKYSFKAKNSYPRVIKDSPIAPGAGVAGGASVKKEGTVFAGFILLCVTHAVMLFLALAIAHSAGLVSVSVGVWDSLGLAVLYVVWRSFDSHIFGSNRKK
jgi:hypothetical protein